MKSLPPHFHQFALFLVLAMIASCAEKPAASDIDKSRITADINQFFSDYFNDIEKEGLLSELKHLDSSQDFFWVPPGYHSPLSIDSVATILKGNAGRFRTVSNKWVDLKITVLSNESAVYTGTLNSTSIDTAGVTNNTTLIETGTLVKRGDAWKLFCGQTAVITP
jgi:hypothetical protein